MFDLYAPRSLQSMLLQLGSSGHSPAKLLGCPARATHPAHRIRFPSPCIEYSWGYAAVAAIAGYPLNGLSVTSTKRFVLERTERYLRWSHGACCTKEPTRCILHLILESCTRHVHDSLVHTEHKKGDSTYIPVANLTRETLHSSDTVSYTHLTLPTKA